MRRVWVLGLLAAVVSMPLVPARAAAAPPRGVPAGLEEARLWGYLDGDKFAVRVGGKTEELNTIGADAPETDKGDRGECYAREAGDRVRKLIPKQATVWLERDEKDKDGKGRLLRYVWVTDTKGKAFLLNERLIREGYASFKSKDGNARDDARLEAAQAAAKQGKKGLWGACGGAHVELKEPPKVGEADNPAPLGTAVETDGQRITVTDAFFSSDYGFATPKGGYVFLVLSVRIENVGDGDHGYDEARFSAKDLDTDATFDDTFTLADNPLGDGELSPREWVEGTVVLEVQESATRVRVKYDAKLIGAGEAYWLVTR
jgi:micrococcal nuclease